MMMRQSAKVAFQRARSSTRTAFFSLMPPPVFLA